MIKYIYADALDAFPTLKETMFKDRAEQFKSRLGWEVNVDENGYEIDEYDAMNPLYVIFEMPDGSHDSVDRSRGIGLARGRDDGFP